MTPLTTLYLINSILLIVHEIDSGIQQEWRLFKIPGESSGFLILHFPLIGLVLYGLIEVATGSQLGIILSFIVSCGGLFAFGIHTYFIRKGHTEFTSAVSQLLLNSILFVSIIQLYFSIYGLK